VSSRLKGSDAGAGIVNRRQWKDLLEGIGFVAIVGSLVLVGLETRNSTKSTELNTQAIEIAAYQELINNISEMNSLMLENEDAAKFILKMRDGLPSQMESSRLDSAFFMQFRHGDIAYFMYERGAIDELRLQSTLKPLPLYGETGRAFWTRHRDKFVAGYQQYVDQLLLEGFWD
jgi:hypothetical protein